MKNSHTYQLPIITITFVAVILSFVQIKVSTPMLLFERLFRGGGWLEILIIAIYAGFITFKIQDIQQSARWRLISWTVFSVFFFSQLVLGILVSETFLLTGKLHIPVPAMMIGGPIYRGQLSIMTLLFLSTIIISGPAWCSQLCYFGAIDGLISKKTSTQRQPISKYLIQFKGVILILTIATAILLKLLNVDSVTATIVGISFGIIGISIIIFYSRKTGKMVHCTLYCPISSLVNVFKYVSPFRIYIDKASCTLCSKCTPACKYDALNIKNIKDYKPGFTCTYCGDCLSTCKDNSIRYKFFKLSPDSARRLYIFLTVSLHAIFLAMGRI